MSQNECFGAGLFMGYISKLLGKNIELLREDAGLSQFELANKMNVSFASVSRWESGKMWLSEESLEKLAMVLGVSVDQFFKELPTKIHGKKFINLKASDFEPGLRECIRVLNENIDKLVIKIKTKTSNE